MRTGGRNEISCAFQSLRGSADRTFARKMGGKDCRPAPGQSQSTNVDLGTQKKPRPIGEIDRRPVRKTASGSPSGRRRNVQTSRLSKLPNIVRRGLSLVSDTVVSNGARATPVLRFRSSHHFAAPSRANFGIKGALASICF